MSILKEGFLEVILRRYGQKVHNLCEKKLKDKPDEVETVIAVAALIDSRREAEFEQ